MKLDPEVWQLMYYLFWGEGAFGMLIGLSAVKIGDTSVAILGGLLVLVAAGVTFYIEQSGNLPKEGSKK